MLFLNEVFPMKMRTLISRGFLLLVFTLGAGSSVFADDAPSWLRQAAGMQVPSFDKKVNAVVLVDDSTITVGEDGQIITVWNYAVRILNREGRDEAVAAIGYETDYGKVKDLHAWLIRPSG